MSHQLLAEQTAELVAIASEGVVSRSKALEPGLTFAEQGLASLAFLRLIDALETRFGVYFDLEDESYPLNSLESLVKYMVDQGVTDAG